MNAFELKTDFFQGPLDLLLYLIRKNRFDIYNINLTVITAEYLGYLQRREKINPSHEGEYLLIAATLIYLKSKQLLGDNEKDDEEKEDLIHNLLAYEQVQKITEALKRLENEALFFWKRDYSAISDFRKDEFYLEELSAFQLAEIFFAILQDFEKSPTRLISSRQHTLQEAQQEILSALSDNGYLDFSFFLSRFESTESIVIYFFSLLELIKQGKLIAVQKRIFGNIELYCRDVCFN